MLAGIVITAAVGVTIAGVGAARNWESDGTTDLVLGGAVHAPSDIRSVDVDSWVRARQGDVHLQGRQAAVWWVAASTMYVYDDDGADGRELVSAAYWVADGSPMHVFEPADRSVPPSEDTGARRLLSGGGESAAAGEGVADGEWIEGKATHYGESYNGSPLGCGTGDYRSDNPRIVAVSPARYAEWPCGTQFEICGDAGCISAERHDACPGCGADHLDLSESGIAAICGEVGTCAIRFRVVKESVTP